MRKYSCLARSQQPRAALKTITRCDKLNIAALGNQVPQLHVHVIARLRTDAAWPKPVWGVKPPLIYVKGERTIFLNALRQLLKLSDPPG
jgi:diadenosine tetraphosphate (Ap4A) HIT family hydrolase